MDKPVSSSHLGLFFFILDQFGGWDLVFMVDPYFNLEAIIVWNIYDNQRPPPGDNNKYLQTWDF